MKEHSKNNIILCKLNNIRLTQQFPQYKASNDQEVIKKLKIEIKYRENTKPEFTKLLSNLKKHEIKNLTLHAPKVIDEIIENYILSVKEFKNNNFKILNINNISSDIKKLWVICYKPVMNFNCNISSDKQKSWILNETQKLHLLNAQLYEIRN